MDRTLAKNAPFYQELEHTGDIGIEIVGPTRPELFRRAALALGALLVELPTVQSVEVRTLEITANDDIDLMHDLLTELLQIFAADGFIWRDVLVEELGPALHVVVQGESFDPTHNILRNEIKAVTYHQMIVENLANRWCARIIFDV